MLSVFSLIFKHFRISSNPFLVANTNQNEKKIAPLCLDCHGLQENAFQVNQLYDVTWSNIYGQNFLKEKLLENKEIAFKNGVKNI